MGCPSIAFTPTRVSSYNHQFRTWLRDQGVYGTWSEPSVPQSNGHAENTVRWLKDRTRTLLKAAGLPLRLWPVAASMAAAEQRAKVLDWRSSLAAPFGAPVHLRRKAFDKAGPLRREFGLESKWIEGKYVGLSTIVHKGHLVYIEATADEKEKFLHTLHVRPDLIDPGEPTGELIVDPRSRPRRRIPEKRAPSGVEMRSISKTTDEWKEFAATQSQKILDCWNMDEAVALVNQLARVNFFKDRKFGVYRHGGNVGWLSGLVEFPELSKVLVKLVLEVKPEAAFTSVMVSHNTTRSMHKDSNNDRFTQNYVIPVHCPDRGGELWVEIKPGDVVNGEIAQRQVNGRSVFGQLYELQQEQCLQFGPRRNHEVCEWSGDRTVLIAYTPDCLGKLPPEDLDRLHDHGFPIPLSQLPEHHGEEPPKVKGQWDNSDPLSK